MTLAVQNRINKMYSAPSSVEERKSPSTEIGPVGQLKLKHADERGALEDRIQARQKKLHAKQMADRERDPRWQNTGQQPEHMVQEHGRQQAEFSKTTAQDRSDLKTRHRAQIEAALAKHGVAP
jgi:Skp family chaperone for outer membrane proteins